MAGAVGRRIRPSMAKIPGHHIEATMARPSGNPLHDLIEQAMREQPSSLEDLTLAPHDESRLSTDPRRETGPRRPALQVKMR